jgi:hypothetical protein
MECREDSRRPRATGFAADLSIRRDLFRRVDSGQREGSTTMRFLLLLGEGDPGDESLGRFHTDLNDAGVLLAGDLGAGFWLVEVASLEEAAWWGRRLPTGRGEVEIRAVAADW